MGGGGGEGWGETSGFWGISHINHTFRDYRVRATQISTEQDSYRILCWGR